MREQEFETKGGFITCREKEGHIEITGYRGQILEAVLPETIDGKCVTEIGKKAFLGCKALRRVCVPDHCVRIGEWAFANCSNLEMVSLPCRKIAFGQGVFKDDKALRNIYTTEAEGFDTVRSSDTASDASSHAAQTAALLAAAVGSMDAAYLLAPEDAGTKEWIEKWDLAMGAVLYEADEEGYQKMVLCGEEDLSINYDDFISQKRRKKARLCLLRLLNPLGLSKERKAELEGYVKKHTKGCESEAAWEVILGEHGDDKVYFELFTSLGCVTEENFEGILADFGERHAPMKSYLMEFHEAGIRTHDFFDSLSL